ncbi:hypothetical protein GPUN_1016 [Glaciecola punicea ACAM 611]|uniref:Uncharacterized protein n=1 Tax=Glaciecola punicea ACAM 611 TaxID=1121923 RepID=H5TA20_9ALTE|nr:hypothetical protein GPUN_1016 [Glaciecola punicea ACAM 611]
MGNVLYREAYYLQLLSNLKYLLLRSSRFNLLEICSYNKKPTVRRLNFQYAAIADFSQS